MLVQLNDTAHHAAVILKVAVPIRVGEDYVRSAVRAMLIGEVEEAAEIGLNAQCVEVVPGHFVAPNLGWIIAGIQSYRSGTKTCQTVKAAVAIAQIEIVGIRLPCGLIAPALDGVETLGSWHILRVQDQRIQYGVPGRDGVDGGNTAVSDLIDLGFFIEGVRRSAGPAAGCSWSASGRQRGNRGRRAILKPKCRECNFMRTKRLGGSSRGMGTELGVRFHQRLSVNEQ